MSTLEDKILGEKLHYYCSSSSEDEENDSVDSDKDVDDERYQRVITDTIEPSFSEWDGTSRNTGPKGVIKDWQRYKQLQVEKREEEAKEQLELINKLILTCRSSLDEEKEKIMQTDPDLAELLSDESLLDYQRQRMKEMLARSEKLRFGKVIYLETADQFLEAIDNEDKSVTIVVHIYENNVPGCEAMNGSLISLAEDYPFVKFCKILGSVAGLSKHFKKEGVPALLVYKTGQVIGNFVHITDDLGVDFYASDVEAFLIEHGMLTDKNCVPAIISYSQNENILSDSE
nr:PREDICTED: phosducin-like protein isoform X1 [Megachile rotundata]XP_012149260.1 PREDICTED: phosducin-like protein isoform X1 [Megachile rotundata]XP_012149261.1 PREDICTED: phosducin-like protein isoform X1 [Megachile rotundata]XP_012149262.1 PREDICTED: phosducin-like protein isoform X1 [Megachile rotundata]XP_012149263.1 PREDICTED: phosducin-like protein isoform X1 [Megachile rotundata]XP_012149264.1 PREDICTED: phosducin-like protein isoform X1 [Megachile rotundata]XP_012149265.1 PREDICTE